MKIIISNSSSTPIYEQIKNAVITQIMSDELSEGDSIPSIRSLAQDIKISVMTIKKAYDELEKEGYIKSEYLEAEETQMVSSSEVENNTDEKEQEEKATKGTLTDNVNVRKTPSTSGEKLGKLSKGTTIDIIEKQEDGWTKIKYNEQEAYVKSDYIQ